MQSLAHVDPNLVLIIEALVLFFIAATFLPVLRRALPAWLRPRFVPALQTTVVARTSVDTPENGNGDAHSGVEITDLEKEE